MFGASKTKQVSSAANYIEDVFSTYLYTGNGSTQTITNSIDLSTKGGLTWIKSRNAGQANSFFDTNRGVSKFLFSNSTAGEYNFAGYGVTNFGTTGFSVTDNSIADYYVNGTGTTYASWTFRKQPKFFDVVTYTGTGSAQNIAHNLGSAPGCIIVKSTTQVSNWQVYHRSLTSPDYWIQLNATNAQASVGAAAWNSTAPTSTAFSVGTSSSVNASGETFVAYLFAHDAGGFGLTGTDNVISCGSVTVPASGNATVTLGWEPQWVLLKRTDSTSGGNWLLLDTMRGMSNTSYAELYPNNSNAESASSTYSEIIPTATGFIGNTSTSGTAFINNATYIYIAIRRGPMKVPTDATKVFAPITTSGDPSNVSVGFPTDWVIHNNRAGSQHWVTSRLTGGTQYTATNSTAAEASFAPDSDKYDLQNNFTSAPFYGGANQVTYLTRRAPSFFDEVCYTGTGSNMTVAHNLGVAPELMIVKVRNNNVWDWCVYAAPLGATKYLQLNLTTASGNAPTVWNNTAPTSSVFTVGTASDVNASSAYNYVAYLFATCPGVSKVGSYTGNGTTQTINCGFAGGARFVLIKRTDSTGDWYVYDTARGMTTLVDPYLLLNSTAAESATLGSVTTVTTGFAVNASILAAINTNGASYIFLAIA